MKYLRTKYVWVAGNARALAFSILYVTVFSTFGSTALAGPVVLQMQCIINGSVEAYWEQNQYLISVDEDKLRNRTVGRRFQFAIEAQPELGLLMASFTENEKAFSVGDRAFAGMMIGFEDVGFRDGYLESLNKTETVLSIASGHVHYESLGTTVRLSETEDRNFNGTILITTFGTDHFLAGFSCLVQIDRIAQLMSLQNN